MSLSQEHTDATPAGWRELYYEYVLPSSVDIQTVLVFEADAQLTVQEGLPCPVVRVPHTAPRPEFWRIWSHMSGLYVQTPDHLIGFNFSEVVLQVCVPWRVAMAVHLSK